MNEQVWYAAELAPGTVVAGWRLLERLGVGGYGAVYHAESAEHPGTFCALKVFLNPRDTRVGREAALLLDKAVHPNVVRCLGMGHWPHPAQGRAFLVLEYVCPACPCTCGRMLFLDIAHRVPAAPVDVNSRIPRALSDIVVRLLAKRPEERYRTGAEVHAALVAAYTLSNPLRPRPRPQQSSP